MSLHVALFSSVLAIGSATASPLDHTRGKRYLTAKIRRNSLATRGSSVLQGQNTTSSVVSDSELAKEQVKDLVNKYGPASDFLDGINLNPESADPSEGYGAFNDTPIQLYFQNTTKPSLVSQMPLLARADVEPILGLPNGSYASFELMPLKDYIVPSMDLSYYGALRFGTPPQELTVSVDTGSADLWVPSVCVMCSNPQFDPAASSTYIDSGRRVALTYGAGRVVGTAAQDTLSLDALTVANQSFLAVHSESQDFMDYPSAGLLGLAFSSISRLRAPTFFERLLAERKLAAAIFSTHLTRGKEDGSQICFGCYDLTKTTGPIQWLNLVTKTYWTIGMDGLAAGNNRTSLSNLVAAVDTGSSLILVAASVAQEFYSLIPGSKDASTTYGAGFYTYPCAQPVAASLVLSGRSFAIHNDDFSLGRLAEDSPDCVGGIVGVGAEYGLPANLAIVGDVFLKSWYVTFDYAGSRIGLAPSINNR